MAMVIAITAIAPLHVAGEPTEPYMQEFILTAYYSPLPDQCCYVLGGERADKIMNGEGRAGADGTPVYPGMIAAPASYPFGTRVDLPGIGVVAVHDRGGAITELPGGPHRLDVWVGFGEEGLARALAFGVQRMQARVYPVGSAQPQEHVDLDALPAPAERLQDYFVADSGLLDVRVKRGDRGLSVLLLQEKLRALGHDAPPSGEFDAQTEAALRGFQRDMGLHEPSDSLTPATAAWVLAASVTEPTPRIDHVREGSPRSDISEAQRVLRYLGYYHGRTTGSYDDNLAAAILRFQQNAGIVGGPDQPGAGIIGPLTFKTIAHSWFKKAVADRAERYLLFKRVAERLTGKGVLPARFLSDGSTGDDVRLVQGLLAERGLFPADKINGVFGPQTKDAVLKFQLKHGLVLKGSDTGAGNIGPATLRALRVEEMTEAYRAVRGGGWGVL
ncbi:MAG: SpoIID/LytB protein [Candidatus Peregrinibacteria bacterium Gr01-1014_25]|nr:MAG: SpoIID/LytB protein [Candidatus Peregrinibacteria bacterium Gr01-1014_25]